jgi:hypothetical protein
VILGLRCEGKSDYEQVQAQYVISNRYKILNKNETEHSHFFTTCDNLFPPSLDIDIKIILKPANESL